MADKSLVMYFLNEEGKKLSLRLDGIKDLITDQEVATVMDSIIDGNIFQSDGGDFKTKDSAQIVSRDVQTLQVK